MSRKTMQKKTVTKRFIRSALVTLLKEQKLEAITVQQIVDNALINRSTFYLHYQDKYDLYNSLVRELLEELNEVIDKTTLYNLDKLIKQSYEPNEPLEITIQFLQHIEKNNDLYSILITDQAFQLQFATIISDAIYNGNGLPRIITNHIAYGSIGTILEWLTKDTPYSMNYIAKLLSRLAISEILEYRNLKID